MDRTQFGAIISRLFGSFPNFQANPQLVESYYLELADLDPERLTAIARTFIREDEFCPSIAQILAMHQGTLTRQRQDEKLRAWREIKRRDPSARESDLVGYEPRKIFNSKTTELPAPPPQRLEPDDKQQAISFGEWNEQRQQSVLGDDGVPF